MNFCCDRSEFKVLKISSSSFSVSLIFSLKILLDFIFNLPFPFYLTVASSQGLPLGRISAGNFPLIGCDTMGKGERNTLHVFIRTMYKYIRIMYNNRCTNRACGSA